MRSIFELCVPRQEVLKGELSEDIFAARLKDVITGDADPIYKDPDIFFENTYPTAGLKTLIKDVVSRLTGNGFGTNAVLRLETAFGGGKTHNLIALYHIARGKITNPAIKKFISPDLRLPGSGEVSIAGIVGSDLEPEIGINHPTENIRTHTLWGELAFQLGGSKGFKIVESSDEKKVAPGTGFLEEIIGDEPTLIMIDEIARHLRTAKAIKVETEQSTLADQTVAFLMALLEFASSKVKCVVVLTLARETDAFGHETAFLQQSLSEALQVTARSERVITPTVETEIPAIVTHRLFKEINQEEARSIFASYMRTYNELFEKNADLPVRCKNPEYEKEFYQSYPFHPELLTTLNRKTSTIPNFNQTRGALRLLAWTVRNLWSMRPNNTWVIHLHDIDLGDQQIAEDLTSRLDRPHFKQVIEADITSLLPGTLSHSQEIDNSLALSNKPPYANQLSSTIFINSLTQGIANGVSPSDLLLAVVKPTDDGQMDELGIIQKTLENLYKTAWFLEYDGTRYRFKTEPSLNKIIEDEVTQVGPTKGRAEIERRIRLIWKKGFLQPIFFPNEAADVADDADLPKLVIMHFDAVRIKLTENHTPDLIKKINEYSGISEGFRRFQNNLMFLACDEDQLDTMIQVARRYLAIGRIMGDADRMGTFNKQQKDELKKAQEVAELDVRIAITKAYRYLYYPSSDAPRTNSYLSRETLPAQDQGDVNLDQSNILIRTLRQLGKAITADDETLSGFYVKSKAWESNITNISTEELKKSFARKIGLKYLLDVAQLRKTIQNGVRNNIWIYYDSSEEFGYDKDSPPASWSISDSTFLYTPEEAARLNLRIKGKWAPPVTDSEHQEICPVCKNPIDQCTCGIHPERPDHEKQLIGEGAVQQAFQQILDKALESEISKISQLIIKIEGISKQTAADMRSLGLAIPQFGKGKVHIKQSVTLSFGRDGREESLALEFNSGWDRYKRLKQVIDPFSQESEESQILFEVTITFDNHIEISSEDLLNIRDILQTLDMGKIKIMAKPITNEGEQV